MIHLDKEAETPLADQIVMQLAGLIQQGHMPSGTRLPSIRRLAGELLVSSATVVAAYDRLIARGLVESRASSGFFVAPQSLGAVRSQLTPQQPKYDAVSTLRQVLTKQEGVTPTGGGFLPEAWLEDTLSTRLLASIARQSKRSFVNTGTAEGYAPLRSQLATKMSTMGIPVHADQILTTFGVTQAFDLICRALISPGDAVVVEEPNYYGLYAQLGAHGARLLPVPRKSDGVDVELLAEVCSRFRPKLYFTQTLMHNPTGTSTGVSTAAEILRIADRHDMLIVEDDIYGDLFPGSNAVRLAQLNRLQRVIFTSSFTKLLSPNVRVGYMAAAPQLIESFLAQKLLSVFTTSEFDERLVYTVLADGGYRKHIERLKNRLAQQKPAVVKGLADAGLRPLQQDHAAVFVWAELPEGVQPEVLIQDAAQHGFMLIPGSLFFVNTPQSPWMRFNMGYTNDRRLFQYLSERMPALRRSGTPAGASVSKAFG
ncbi:MAG: PLP-dependent aminotransferase family protein [Burkholderiales bacterium]|nr:PLP-dependent aminotransferase family protein [Burkholderiales bacterium]